MKPIDWSGIVIELEATGLGVGEIAHEVGLAQNSVSEIKHGQSKAPRGDAAVALYLLHQQRTRRHGRKSRTA